MTRPSAAATTVAGSTAAIIMRAPGTACGATASQCVSPTGAPDPSKLLSRMLMSRVRTVGTASCHSTSA